jgi:hypothetical protein
VKGVPILEYGCAVDETVETGAFDRSHHSPITETTL